MSLALGRRRGVGRAVTAVTGSPGLPGPFFSWFSTSNSGITRSDIGDTFGNRTYIDHNELVRNVPAEAFRRPGARGVYNEINSLVAPSPLGGAPSPVEISPGEWELTGFGGAGGGYRFGSTSGGLQDADYVSRIEVKIVSGSGSVYLDCVDKNVKDIILAMTTEYQVFTNNGNNGSNSYRFFDISPTPGLTIRVRFPQLEKTTGNTDPTIPSEFVPRGVGSGAEMSTDNFGIPVPFLNTLDSSAATSFSTTGVSGSSRVYQNYTLVPGLTYTLRFQVDSLSSGFLTLFVREGADGVGDVVTSGTDTFVTFTADQAQITLLWVASVTGADFSVSGITVRALGHNSNADGFKYFTYENGNTVDGSGVVTESQGPAINPATMPGIQVQGEVTELLGASADLANPTYWEGTATATKDIVGVDGHLSGFTLSDTSTSAQESWRRSANITNGGDDYYVRIAFKKDPSPSVYPSPYLVLEGGSPTRVFSYVFDPSDGSYVLRPMTNIGEMMSVIEVGDYWYVTTKITNNNSGNDEIRVAISPAFNSDGSDAQVVSTVGSAGIGFAEVYKDVLPVNPTLTYGGATKTVISDTGLLFAGLDFSSADAEGSYRVVITPHFDAAPPVNERIIRVGSNHLLSFRNVDGQLRWHDGSTAKNFANFNSNNELVVEGVWGDSSRQIRLNGSLESSSTYDGSWNPSGNVSLFPSLTHACSVKSIEVWDYKRELEETINTPPVVLGLDGVASYIEDDTLVSLPDITVSDADPGDLLTATSTLSNPAAGSLTTSSSATYNAGTGVWTITGSASVINAAWAAMSFVPIPNFSGNFTITNVVDDGDEDGSGPLSGTTTVTGTAANDAPTATNLDSTINYTEDGSVTLPTIVTSDIDGDSLVVTGTVSDNLAGAFNEPSGATYNSGTGVLSITGSVSAVNTALSGLTFTLSENYNDDFTVSWIVSDGTESDTGTWTLNGTPVNDSPEATNTTGTVAYDQGDSSVDLPVIVVSDVDGDTITVDMVLQDPTFGSIITPGSSTYNAGTGEWQVSGSVSAVNAVLASLGSGGFVPDSGTDTDTSIIVTVSDGTVSLPDGTITLDVNPTGGVTLPVTSGLVAHYDAALGITADGSNIISSWADQSGSGNDLTASGDPTLVASGLGGLPIVRFDGAGDILQRVGGLSNIPLGAADRTVFVLVDYQSVGYGGFGWGNNSVNRLFGVSVSNTGNLMIQGWGGANDFSTSEPGTGEGWLVQSVVVDSNQMTHYLDGTQIDTQSHIYNTLGTRLVLGAEIDGSPNLDMDVAEVLVYDRALSASELAQVEAYLSDKYSTSFDPADLFGPADYGHYSVIGEETYQTTAGVTPSAVSDPIGRVNDQSGSGTNRLQATASARPLLTVDGAEYDGADDKLGITLASGVIGTYIHAYDGGLVIGEVNLSSGAWNYPTTASYKPSRDERALFVIDRELSVSELGDAVTAMSSTAGGSDFAGATSMAQWFRDSTGISFLDASGWDTSSVTSFDGFARNSSLIDLDASNWDVSSATVFGSFVRDSSSLATLDISGWDTSSVTNFGGFCAGTSITTLDISGWDTSSVTVFVIFAQNATSLTNVIVNGGSGSPFSDSPCTNYSQAFLNTNLSQQSIDDILVAINTAGTAGGLFNQSGGSAPSATGETAIDALRVRGWTVTVTGGY